MIGFILSIIIFLLLFWLISTKFPKLGHGIISTGDKVEHAMFDKKHISEEGDNVNIFGLIWSKLKKFGRWFKGLFKRKNKVLTEN